MSMMWLKGEREGLDGYRDSNTELPKEKEKSHLPRLENSKHMKMIQKRLLKMTKYKKL